VIELKGVLNYETEYGSLGPREQAFLGELGPLEVVGEGHEAVTVRPHGSSHVYKVFRQGRESKYAIEGEPSTSQRIESEVFSGTIPGLSPPTERIDLRIVKRPYVPNVNKAKIGTALRNNDIGSVHSTVNGLKRYHDQGLVFVDASLTNSLDPGITGYVTVDGAGTRRARHDEEFVHTDLRRILKKTYHDGSEQQAETFIGAVRGVYGSRIAEKLGRYAPEFKAQRRAAA
jgi:hypothetical protein